MWIIWGFSLTQDHKYSLENDFSLELMNTEDDETDEDEDKDKDEVSEHDPVLLAVQENDETEEIELVE